MRATGAIPATGRSTSMWLLNNLRIGVKLPMVMVLIGVVSLALAEMIATRYTRESVLEAGAERLAAVARARASEMRSTMLSVRGDVRSNLKDPVILEAARALVHAHERLGSGAEAEAELRRLYVDENPNSPSERSRLADAGDRSSYSLVHRRYHDFFSSVVQGRGYSDLYLVSPGGRVIYSVEKGPLFGRDIATDRALDPPFAAVFEAARSQRGPAVDAVADFGSDPPGGSGVSALFAIPVKSPLGSLEAVLVKRFPISGIEIIMNRPAGLGHTGEVLLVGSDRRPRVRAAGAGARAARLPDVEAEPVSLALSGTTGVLRHPDRTGRTLITAFAPVHAPGFRYAVLARMSEDEILSAAARIRDGMLTEGSVALAFVTFFGLALARSMSVPLTRVGEAMDRVGTGNYEDAIPERRRRDEIGGIARRLDAFRSSLLFAESMSRENAFKGSAFQSTASAMMLVDRDLTIIHVNRAMVDLMARNRIAIDRQVPDFRPDALSGRNLTTFYPGAAALREGSAEDGTNLAEIRFGQRHFRLAISPVRDGDGARLGHVVEWVDVTDVRMNQVLLDVINGRFPIAGFSADGRVVAANPLFETWCGIEPGGLSGRSWDWLFCRSGPAGAEPENPRWAAAAGLAPGGPIELTPAGPCGVLLSATLSAVRDTAGHLQRYVLIASHAVPEPGDDWHDADLRRLLEAS